MLNVADWPFPIGCEGSWAVLDVGNDDRLVVALRFYRDLTIEEIARQLDIRPGTVQSRLHYAMKRLHGALDAADAKGMLR